jgi:hypothetical protein
MNKEHPSQFKQKDELGEEDEKYIIHRRYGRMLSTNKVLFGGEL